VATSVEGTATGPAPDRFDLGAVQAELAKIWKSAESDSAAHDKVRACAVNFVIPIEPDTFQGWQESLAELARLVPAASFWWNVPRTAPGLTSTRS